MDPKHRQRISSHTSPHSTLFPPPVRLRLKFSDYDSDSSAASYSSSFSHSSSYSSSTAFSTDASSSSAAMPRQSKLGDFPKLRQYGWQVVKTLGDGNCLFRALSTQIKHSATNYRLVRSAIVAEMRANAEIYRPFMALDLRRSTRLAGRRTFNSSFDISSPSDKDRDHMYETRLSSMGRDGTWGDHLEIQAFCNSYRMNVVLFVELGAREPLIFSPMHLAAKPDEAAALPTVFLTYHLWQHYSSVGCTASSGKMPATLAEFRALASCPVTSRESTPGISETPSLITEPSSPSSCASDTETAPITAPHRAGKRARRVIEDEDEDEDDGQDEGKPKPTIKRIRLIVR